MAAAQRLAPGIGHLRFLASALGLAVPGVVTAICRLWSMELRRSSRGVQRLCDEQREGEQVYMELAHRQTEAHGRCGVMRGLAVGCDD